MKKNQLILLAVLVLIFLSFFFLAIFISSKKIVPAPSETQVSQSPQISLPQKEIKLFLLRENGTFFSEERAINTGKTNLETIKNFVELLLSLKGRNSLPLPLDLSLRSVFLIEKKNLLVLDFNASALEKFPSGTESELEFIYFFVNNICFNFADIKQVQFLFDGREITSLSGHLDLETPFRPDFSLFTNE